MPAIVLTGHAGRIEARYHHSRQPGQRSGWNRGAYECGHVRTVVYAAEKVIRFPDRI